MPNNLFLCGFMGCGKSTVGKAVAHRLGLRFLDLDRQIEAAAGRSIPAIFAECGEDGFRTLETEALRTFGTQEGFVVATGGGTLLRPENVALTRAAGWVVFLDCPFERCYGRIRNSDRPLVQTGTRKTLEELYEKRRPLYQKAAHQRVDAFRSASIVTRLVVEAAQQALATK